ncbi:3323_t:CDS:2, partial [Gigaspora margarita]
KKQLHKELSQDQQSCIISTYLCGFKPFYIAQALSLSKSTVYNTVKWYKETEVLFEHDKHALVCIANMNLNEKYHKEYINPTVKFGSSSVMFWEYFSWWRVEPLVEVKGNMNSDSYINILTNHFIPWASSLLKKYLNEIELIFQQDLASVHTSEYLEYPDLNPIENIWEHLDSAVYNKRLISE